MDANYQHEPLLRCYTNESTASDLPIIRSKDIRSIRSVDSFPSYLISNWQIGEKVG